MKNNQQRRHFIRNMVLAGFTLYLPSCTNSTKPDPNKETEPKPKEEDKLEAIIQEIEENFQSENVSLLRATDEQYDALNVGFNLRVPQKPKIIALVKNVEGISEAIKYAKQFKLQVGVKSGGHSFEGFSSNEGGMCINLSLMKGMQWIDDDHVKLESGVILKEVYDALLPKGKIIPSGSCAGVGIGGLTLGGGYGLFSRQLGLTCDSLVGLTFVDGQGNIHYAKNNDEILWACRGGGNGNFGVIADMSFRVHEAPKLFTRHLFKAYKLDTPRAIALLKNWFDLTAQLPNSCFGAYVLNGKSLTVLITDSDHRIKEIRPLLEQFGAEMDKTTIGNPEADIAKALRRYYGIQTPLFFKNACAGLYDGFGSIEHSIEAVVEKVRQNPGLIYQVNTLGGNINKPEFEAVSSYPHRQYAYLGELQAYYENPEKGEDLIQAFQEIQEEFTNGGITAHYRNYPDINFDNWEEAYYGENYARLQNFKRKYDPENLIRHPQSVKV